jgi:DNA-binding transcriptional LysR family regulator
MKLDGVEVFAEVVEAGSFVAAARRLGMPTTTVSARVARLEAKLGVTLIQRTTRKLRVTEAGRSYYSRCAAALAELRQGERELDEAKTEPSGLIRITAPPNLARSLLASPIARFLARYPQCSIDVIATNRQIDLLSEGVDLALRVGPLRDSSLVARKFRAGRVCLWAARSYLRRMGEPASVADLAKHQVIRFSRLPERITLRSKGEIFDVQFDGRLSADDHDVVKLLVLRGLGVGLLPEFVVEEAAASAELQRVLPDVSSEDITVYLAYPAQRHVPASVRAFIELATSERDLA